MSKQDTSLFKNLSKLYKKVVGDDQVVYDIDTTGIEARHLEYNNNPVGNNDIIVSTIKSNNVISDNIARAESKVVSTESQKPQIKNVNVVEISKKSDSKSTSEKNVRGHSNSEILNLLNVTYNNQVMCTNGLFHMYDKFRNEIYIDKSSGKMDNRARYKTIYVADKVVVADIINHEVDEHVILDKESLQYIFKTKNKLKVQDNLIYEANDKLNGEYRIFSDSGKSLVTYPNIISIEKAYKNIYIVKTQQMYEDRLIIFDRRTDSFKDLTENKRYVLVNRPAEYVEVHVMNGGVYNYSFYDQSCVNTFTNEEEKNIQLWSIV